MTDDPLVAQLRRRAARDRQARQQAEAIAEAELRRAYRRSRDLELLGVVAATSNRAVDASTAYREVLPAMRAHVGFAVGHVLVPDGRGAFVSSGLWDIDPEYEEFARVVARATETARFLPPVGLPGEVAATGLPRWVPDISLAPNFPRQQIVRQGSGFAFPVLSGTEVVAVIEFLDPSPRASDEPLLGLSGDIGVQLGRVVERERARRAEADHMARMEDRVSERTMALLQARDAAQAANRAKSTFLAHVGHELGTPLHTVSAALAAVTERADLPHEAVDDLGVARRAVEHLALVVGRVLELIDAGGRTDPPVEPAVPSQLLAEIASRHVAAGRVSVQPGEGAEVAVLLPSEPLVAAVRALVDNAVQHTRGRVELGVAGGPDGLRWTVRDEGPGFDPDALPALLDPLSSVPDDTATPTAGIGLGLPFAASVARRLGGSLDVATSQAGGTTAVLSHPVRGPSAARRPGPRRVLLADDNAVNRRLTAGMVRRLGFEVDEVADGAQAVQAAHAHEYGLVLMDVRMPVLDGRSATRQLRQATTGATPSDVPVLAISAQAGADERDACLAAGMDGFVAKPFGVVELRAAVRPWFALDQPGADPAR